MMVEDDRQQESSAEELLSQTPRSEDTPRSSLAGDVTRILAEIEQGDGHAARDLLPLVYDELKKLAAAKMAHEKPGQTLQATALVHEAYLRLVDVEQTQHWNSRGHFFSAAAEAMRRILVESARHKARPRHGGDHRRIPLDDAWEATAAPADELLDLDAALTRLAAHDPAAAQVVQLRWFAGLSVRQVAAALGIPPRTAERQWTYARTWLHRTLTAEDHRARE